MLPLEEEKTFDSCPRGKKGNFLTDFQISGFQSRGKKVRELLWEQEAVALNLYRYGGDFPLCLPDFLLQNLFLQGLFVRAQFHVAFPFFGGVEVMPFITVLSNTYTVYSSV